MRVALAVAIVLGTPRIADACYPMFTRAIVGTPQLEPAGAVTITSEDVAVTCDGAETCTVTSTFGLAVTQSARATVRGAFASELALTAGSRAPVAASPPSYAGAWQLVTIELTPADNQLVINARVALPDYRDDCFTDGVIARHPYLASAPKGNQRILQIDTTSRPRIDKPSGWDMVVDTRDATETEPAATRLWFTMPGLSVTHGGPFVLLGLASADGRTFRARVGWEAAIGKPWLVFALAGETDFADAWNVALTAEPMSRAWVLPLSFGAGGGVVLADGSRVGGRGQLSIALGLVRVMLSVDVIQARDDSGIRAGATGLLGASF
ncbi:MAG TPA: hypothetical protein VIV11_12615 [Kofleriaceae bacterium]